MIAVDSGFLYALADGRDSWHVRAMQHRASVEEGWVTTWPVLTETCHLLSRRLGPDFAATLIDDVGQGVFGVWELPGGACRRIHTLMRRYAKLPMDLADASLLLLAEHLGHGRILSTDERDFGVSRWKSRKPFHNLLS